MKISADALLFDNDGTLISSLESVHRCWGRWATEYGIPAEDFARVELLGRLPADRWAVVTSANRRLAEARLAAVGISPALLVSADDITRGKPDPEPFLLAAAKLG